jgi:hypothetical protein
MTRREALLAMGYQEREPGKWLKPVGIHCFSYIERLNRWENWFKDMKGTLQVYEAHEFCESDPLRQLKDWEAWTRINVCHGSGSSFELFAIDIWPAVF